MCARLRKEALSPLDDPDETLLLLHLVRRRAVTKGRAGGEIARRRKKKLLKDVHVLYYSSCPDRPTIHVPVICLLRRTDGQSNSLVGLGMGSQLNTRLSTCSPLGREL